jgi:hypothetical protein
MTFLTIYKKNIFNDHRVNSTYIVKNVKLKVINRSVHVHKLLSITRRIPPVGSSVPNLNFTPEKPTEVTVQSPTQPVAQVVDQKNVDAPINKNTVSSIYDRFGMARIAQGSVSTQKMDMKFNKSQTIVPYTEQYSESTLTLLSAIKNLKENQIKNDPHFVNLMLDQILNDPVHINRGLQVSLEVLYPRRQLQQDLVENFLTKNPKISIQDVVNRNNGLIDQSVIYTLSQTKHLLSQSTYGCNLETAVIIPTCLGNLNNLPQNVSQFMVASKKATGNTICDLLINGIPYDHKCTDVSYGKNNIFSGTYEEIMYTAKFRQYLGNVFKIISNFNKNLQDHELNNLISKMREIQIDPYSTEIQKLDQFNFLLFRKIEFYTSFMNIPILFPTTREPFVPTVDKKEIDALGLPKSKSLNPKDVLAANQNYVNKNWTNKQKNIAGRETDNIIGNSNTNSDEVD